VLSAQVLVDAYLFLGDAWYPDWVVRVDGIETPIQRADYIFRAVRLTPGMHQIEFEYRPRSLIIGAVISVATLIVLAVIWIRNRG